jgi:uncharacterized protein (TIGR02246 family)
MTNFKQMVFLVAGFAALAACAKTGPSVLDATEGMTTVRSLQDSWYKAYNAGDGAAVAALYAEDAVLSPPNKPAVRGGAAIHEYFLKDAAAFSAAGLTGVQGATSDVGVSGELAWQGGTYKVTDKSGATVDVGKTLTVFQRKSGKWMMIRDTWNSDAALAALAGRDP